MTRKISGLIMSVGALVFIIGVTRPVIADFIGAGFSRRRQLIELNYGEWLLGNLGMGVGGLIIGAGIVIFAFAVHQRTPNWIYRLLAYAAAITGIVATSCWMYISYGRVTLPTEIVSFGLRGRYLMAFDLYTDLIILSIILTGFVTLVTYSRIGGVLIIAAEIGVVWIALALWNEIIPGVHPPAAFVAGVVLMFAPSLELRRNIKPKS